jgi:hypothetical protein
MTLEAAVTVVTIAPHDVVVVSTANRTQADVR